MILSRSGDGRRRSRTGEPTIGLLVEDASAFRLVVDNRREFGLAAEELAKIDDVENEKRAGFDSDDRRVARSARQECNLAKKFARTKANAAWA